MPALTASVAPIGRHHKVTPYDGGMVDFGQVTRDDVREAIAEHDESGSATPGLYTLTYGGRTYSALHLAAAAYQWATGDPLTDAEVADEAAEAAGHLQALAFEVSGPDLPPLRYATAATVGQEHARATWALAARERLMETASTYHAVITVQELADHVQRRSLIRTSQQPRAWLGDVLARVAEECVRRAEPLLPALCVDARGRTGNGYAGALELHRGEHVADPEEHAAQERLECYRRFRATLPPGGGEPMRTDQQPPRRTTRAVGATRVAGADRAPAGRSTRPAASRPAAKKAPAKAAEVEKPLVTCPVHFTVLPANGVCDLCD